MNRIDEILSNDAGQIEIPKISAEQMLTRIKAMSKSNKKRNALVPILALSFASLIAITTPIVYFNVNQDTNIQIGFNKSNNDEDIAFNWNMGLKATKDYEPMKTIDVFYGHKSFDYLFENMNLIYDTSSVLNISISRCVLDKNGMRIVDTKTIFSNNVNFEDVFLGDSYLFSIKNNKYEFRKSIIDQISIDDLKGFTEGFINYRIIVSANDDIGFTGIYNSVGSNLEKMTSFGNSESLAFSVKDNDIGLDKSLVN